MYLISQPASRLLDKIVESLNSNEYNSFSFSVAYAKMSGVELIREPIINFRERGGTVNGIVGIDQKNTSIEALRELITLCNSIRIFHCENLSQTFHPKFYLFDKQNARSNLIVGSGNLTNGGLLNNFELNMGAFLKYDEPSELELINQTKQILANYIEKDSLCKPLDNDFLNQLISGNYVSSEEDQTIRLVQSAGGRSSGNRIFGQSEGLIRSRSTEISIPNASIVSESESEIEEYSDEAEEAENELNAGFWKRLRKNDVSKTSSPGQIIIPIAYRQHFPPFINLHTTEAGGQQEEVFMNIRFIKPNQDEIDVHGARAVFYTPAPEHPRQNIDFRFTFRNDEILESLRIDDILVFQKSNTEGVDFIVKHIKPDMPAYQAFSGRYNNL